MFLSCSSALLSGLRCTRLPMGSRIPFLFQQSFFRILFMNLSMCCSISLSSVIVCYLGAWKDTSAGICLISCRSFTLTDTFNRLNEHTGTSRGVAKGGKGGHMPPHHFSLPLHQKCLNYIYNTVKLSLYVCSYT